MFDESTQIVVSHNGVTMLKPHWMSQEHWQKYEVPRCGKAYSNKGVLYGQTVSQGKLTELKQQAQEASTKGSGECDGCTI